jgi:hypothetical protein
MFMCWCIKELLTQGNGKWNTVEKMRNYRRELWVYLWQIRKDFCGRSRPAVGPDVLHPQKYDVCSSRVSVDTTVMFLLWTRYVMVSNVSTVTVRYVNTVRYNTVQYKNPTLYVIYFSLFPFYFSLNISVFYHFYLALFCLFCFYLSAFLIFFFRVVRKANWIGHILRRNCLLKRVIEGKLEGRIEMRGRRGRRRKHILDDLKEKRRYWKLK